MWASLLERGGLLDDPGALAHLRATSISMRAQQYGRWLAWLAAHDPAALEEPPTSRLTLDRLGRWLEALASVSPISRHMFVVGALHVLRVAAPRADWAAHLKVETRLRIAAGRGSQARKRGRVLSSSTLLEAGLRHAGSEADQAPTPLAAAKRRRDGLMMAMLALLPMRRRAFASLRIGE